MNDSKTVLFVTHHNNDFDNFLPVIVGLKKENINIKVLALHTKHEILQNKLHNLVCDTNNIFLDSFTDMYRFKLFTEMVVKIHNYILKQNILDSKVLLNKRNSKLILYDCLKSPTTSALRALRSFCSFYLRLGSLLLLDCKKVNHYLKDVDVLITDMRNISKKQLIMGKISKLLSFVQKGFLNTLHDSLFKVMSIGRNRGIPIVMMPHGVYPVIGDEVNERLYDLDNDSGFHSDYLFLGNDASINLHRSISGIKETIALGVPRYDKDWVGYLDYCASQIPSNTFKSNRTVVLFIADAFPYIKDRSNLWQYNFERDKAILSLINEIDDIEIWVKHHPRNDHRIPIEGFIPNDKQQYVKQFGIGHDTNVLVANADIVVSQLSSVLVAPILLKKPVIVYEKWKELLPDAQSIFDSIKTKARNIDELKKQIENIMQNGYNFTDKDITCYCKSIFPIKQVGDTMTQNYVKKIKEILNE